MDSKLWKVENYHDFLAERRAFLASAANDFLHQLQTGTAPSQLMNVDQIRAPQIVVNDEDKAINELVLWIADKDLPMPERDFEILDSNTDSTQRCFGLARGDSGRVE